MKSTFEQVISAEQQRCSAMLSGDINQLKNILDERMIFCHATGRLDNKEAYLSKMAEGAIHYHSIEWDQPSVIDLAGSAILTGRMTTHVSVAGTKKTLNNQVISIWSESKNTEQSQALWKLVAFQSTPISQ